MAIEKIILGFLYERLSEEDAQANLKDMEAKERQKLLTIHRTHTGELRFERFPFGNGTKY